MFEYIKYASNNSFLAGVMAVIVTGGGIWIWNAYRDFSDSKKIYNFLVVSKDTSDFKFRSTESIASNTQLAEERVAKLCASHAKIRRNEKTKQSWQLKE